MRRLGGSARGYLGPVVGTIWGLTRACHRRSILAFQEWFVDEQACLDDLFECRWPEGFACPRCGGRGEVLGTISGLPSGPSRA